MKIKQRLKNVKKKERKAKKVTYFEINYFTQIFRVLIQCLAYTTIFKTNLSNA